MNEGTKSVNVRDYYNNGYKQGFQKGKIEEKKEELEWLKTMTELSFICPECERSFVLKNFRLVNRIKQLQKEINSQTEQNSDKEVAQPYSKSDKTTKEIGEMK